MKWRDRFDSLKEGLLRPGKQGSAARIGSLQRKTGARQPRQMERLKNGWVYLLREHPVILAGLGLVAGAALGGALPNSSRTGVWSGRKGESYRGRWEATGEEGLESHQAAALATKTARNEEPLLH